MSRVFNGRTESVYMFDTGRAHGMRCCCCRLLFNSCSYRQGSFELSACVVHGTVQVLLLMFFVWELCSLALTKALDYARCLWRSKTISLLRTFDTDIRIETHTWYAVVLLIDAMSLTWPKSWSTSFCRMSKWRSRLLCLEEERASYWCTAFGDLSSS